jgi:hypothetical protein
MRNVRSRVTAMVAGLEQNPHVEVLTIDLADPASQEDIDHATRLANGVLPAGVEDFYREVGAFRLEWQHTLDEISHGDLSDHGFINILPVPEVFGDWRDVTWFDEDDQQFRPVKPFDMFVPEACTAFLQPPDDPPADAVAYHYFGEELCDTGYTFDDYLKRLLASRGYWYWVQTLCPDKQDSAEVVDFRNNMPVIFPDYDDEPFHPRTKA